MCYHSRSSTDASFYTRSLERSLARVSAPQCTATLSMAQCPSLRTVNLQVPPIPISTSPDAPKPPVLALKAIPISTAPPALFHTTYWLGTSVY
ncbi:hypothetical protein C8Q70DRAFT_14481 [Cubamyces menziesii]|nr:hypothetical protein C8Q70DRAFT_14481 [Cubamyces menziesii]